MPQIDGLTIEDFEKFARKKPNLMKHLPDDKDWHNLDKKWVSDVLYTLDTAGIQQIITQAQVERRKKLEQSQNMMVDLRPEFALALRKCAGFGSKCSPMSFHVQVPEARQHSFSRDRRRRSDRRRRWRR